MNKQINRLIDFVSIYTEWHITNKNATISTILYHRLYGIIFLSTCIGALIYLFQKTGAPELSRCGHMKSQAKSINVLYEKIMA